MRSKSFCTFSASAISVASKYLLESLWAAIRSTWSSHARFASESCCSQSLRSEKPTFGALALLRTAAPSSFLSRNLNFRSVSEALSWVSTTGRVESLLLVDGKSSSVQMRFLASETSFERFLRAASATESCDLPDAENKLTIKQVTINRERSPFTLPSSQHTFALIVAQS